MTYDQSEAAAAAGATRVPAGRGVDWIADGWRVFTASPGMWIVLTLIWILVNIALQTVPVVGPLVAWVIAPALAGGLLLAATDARAGRELDLASLFRPVVDPATRNPILVLGAMYLAANLGVIVLGVLALVAGAGTALMHQPGAGVPLDPMQFDPARLDPSTLLTMGGVALLVGLVVTALLLLVVVLFYFAIPLVTFERMDPTRAVGIGTPALLRNWAPLTVLGLLYLPLAVLATLPLMLGWLILVPMTFGMWLASYRDVFPAVADPGPGRADDPTLPPPA